MSPTLRNLRPFLATCLGVWIALIFAAIFYSQQHPVDTWILTAALPAFLLESFFYLGATVASARTLFEQVKGPITKAILLWASTLVPYLVFSSRAGTFEGHRFFLLFILTAVMCFWQVLMPRRWMYDIGFLVIAAAPVITKVFARIYVSPDAHLHVADLLGHVMWLRTGICVLLAIRQWDPGGFGLWPTVAEWKIGVISYIVLILPLSVLARILNDVQIAPLQRAPLEIAGIAVGTFFGVLWVVALGEELLFRGVVARALLNVQSSAALAIGVSSLLFGTAHLWFHQFPNWRRALVASLLGAACGTAYFKADSVKAPMVTHALVVTTWRLFFK